MVDIGDQAPDFELVDIELMFRRFDEFNGIKVVSSLILANTEFSISVNSAPEYR